MEFMECLLESNISKTKLQEIQMLFNDIEVEHGHYNEAKLIYDTVEEIASENGTLPTETLHKVKKICAEENDGFKNFPKDCQPLGLMQNSLKESDLLTFNEASNLRSIVEERLASKCLDIKSNESSKILPVTLPIDSVRKSSLLKLKETFFKEVADYHSSVIKMLAMLQEMTELFVKMAETNSTRASCLEQELHAIHSKAKFAEAQVSEKKYFDHKDTLTAIEKINMMVEQGMKSVLHELHQLKAVKEHYDYWNGSEEYRKIVKEYKELQKLIKEKKSFLQMFGK